jgi:hypothetical protein
MSVLICFRNAGTGENTLQEKAAEPFMDSGLAETEFPRTQIGISIANPTHRRLVEGVSAQLGVLPSCLEEADLAHSERIAEVEMLIADEAIALRFQQAAGIPEDPGEGIRLAVVAAIAVSSQSLPILPNRNRERAPLMACWRCRSNPPWCSHNSASSSMLTALTSIASNQP